MPEETGRTSESRLGVLGWLGDFAYYRGEAILVVAMVLVAAATVFGRGVFNAVKPFGFQDPDSESGRAADAYEDATGVEAVPGVVAVVRPNDSAKIRAVASQLEAVPGVARVMTGLDPGANAGISRDRGSVLVLGYIGADVDDTPAVGTEAQERLGGARGVELGGTAVAQEQINSRSEDDLRRAELIALPILFLLTLWVFRGFVAALFPIVVGTSSIVLGLGVMRALTEVVDIDVFALNLVTALGLGLALVYCLFIICRYREELEHTGPGPEAVIRTMQTAGRTVAFSSVTIAAALAALLVFPQRFLYSMGIGGVVVALLSGLIVLTVVPAILTPLGSRINALAPRVIQRRRRGGRGWFRVARFVMRHRLPVATLTAAAMVIAGLPFLRVELTLADARTLPEDTSARMVDTALKSDFEADPGASMVIVLDRPSAQLPPRVTASLDRLSRDPALSPGYSIASAERGLTRVDVPIRADPNSAAATDAVERARAIQWGASALVAGRSAELLDGRESISEKLPIAIAIVVAVTFALLFLMTGSVVLPVQALVMNLLTVSVALGVMVLVFQDGRLEGLLDYKSYGAIDRSVPILLGALVFGLSTDYGIFVITRMQEERSSGARDSQAIALGLERSGRIVTSAALLLSVAIGAVAFSSLDHNKQLAIGAAVGILVDATLVRALLFPAVMRLCGRWTWWAPGWLRRMTRVPQAPPRLRG